MEKRSVRTFDQYILVKKVYLIWPLWITHFRTGNGNNNPGVHDWREIFNSLGNVPSDRRSVFRYVRNKLDRLFNQQTLFDCIFYYRLFLSGYNSFEKQQNVTWICTNRIHRSNYKISGKYPWSRSVAIWYALYMCMFRGRLCKRLKISYPKAIVSYFLYTWIGLISMSVIPWFWINVMSIMILVKNLKSENKTNHPESSKSHTSTTANKGSAYLKNNVQFCITSNQKD